MKVYLTVNGWINIEQPPRDIPFSCTDSRGIPWYRVMPSTHSKFDCCDCGQPVTCGWKMGIRSKTAVCDSCVSLTDPRDRRTP